MLEVGRQALEGGQEDGGAVVGEEEPSVGQHELVPGCQGGESL